MILFHFQPSRAVCTIDSELTTNAQTRKQMVLPDPDECRDCDVVLFDGQCNFCRGGVEQLRRLDIGGKRLAYLSMHDPRVGERYPELSYDDLMAQMYVVDQAGNQHGGADAVRYLSRRLPLLWIVSPLLHFPGTAGLWHRMYGWVAKNRYRIAGRNCDSGTCSIHQR